MSNYDTFDNPRNIPQLVKKEGDHAIVTYRASDIANCIVNRECVVSFQGGAERFCIDTGKYTYRFVAWGRVQQFWVNEHAHNFEVLTEGEPK